MEWGRAARLHATALFSLRVCHAIVRGRRRVSAGAHVRVIAEARLRKAQATRSRRTFS